MRRHRPLAALGLAVSLAAFGPASVAQTTPAPQPDTGNAAAASGGGATAATEHAHADGSVADDPSERVLRRYAAFAAQVQTARVLVRSSYTIASGGRQQERVGSFAVEAARPNQIAFRPGGTGPQGPPADVTLVSDGERLHLSVPALKKYASDEAPASLAQITQTPAAAALGPAGGALAFLASMFSEDPYARTLEGVTKISYAGIEEIGGTKCHRLDLVQEQVDLRVWIETGDRPFLRRIVPDLSKLGGGTPGAVAEMTLDLTGWEIDPRLPAAAFAFEPPAAAERADSVSGMLNGPAGARTGLEKSGEALKGEPAPAFELATLGGGKMDLARHRGKDVVILDFWATWCGPCVQALPTLSKVAKAYESKGVVFYAVDQSEDGQRVGAFLAKRGLELRVALDTDTAVGRRYGANAIPLTVLIARDGTVADIQVGFDPALEQDLIRKLDALLAADGGDGSAAGSASAPRG